MEAFETMTDEQIAIAAQAGDTAASEYLLTKYKNFVRNKARSYFLVGADHEDVVEEGMIGLFKAIRDFRDDRQASFRGFADTSSPARSSPPSRRRPVRSTFPSITMSLWISPSLTGKGTVRSWRSSVRTAGATPRI